MLMRAPQETHGTDAIGVADAPTLDRLFGERLRRTPDKVAYRAWDAATRGWRARTWREIGADIARWQAAMQRDGLAPGERVAIMMHNSPEWAIADEAALGLALVTVPLYMADRAENVAYIVNDCGARLLVLEDESQWDALKPERARLSPLTRIVVCGGLTRPADDPRVVAASDWLPASADAPVQRSIDGGQLATIIYTSGTTGRPKGVMLSHSNILSNAHACLDVLEVHGDDVFLSFLPLSHSLERTGGYYMTMMVGAEVAFARSVQHLPDDLLEIRPTILVSVPRIYERVWAAIRAKLDDAPAPRRKLFERAVEVGWLHFEHEQGREPWHSAFLTWPMLRKLVADKVLARLGGRLRVAISGGAALSPDVSRVFIGLGLPILQGYGLTEAAPVVCANRLEDNVPASVGRPVNGVEVRIAARNELFCRGPNVMLGYWNNRDATRAVIDDDGWLHTGDTARIDDAGHVFITGRLKEIVVLSNGEKISPFDAESAILNDRLFEQVMLVGEGRPYLSALVVVDEEQWDRVSADRGLAGYALDSRDVEEFVLARIAKQLHAFPGYAQVRRAAVTAEPWSIDNGLMTPTLKLKRARVLEAHARDVARLYAGHE